MTLYLEILNVLKILLERSDNSHWANWISQDILEWNENKSTKHHISAYGGMGSINDLSVGENDTNGSWKNAIFEHAKALAYSLAQRKGIGGVELVDTSSKGVIIQGWRCLECGYGEISKVEIETYISNKMVPNILTEKINNGNVKSILDIAELKNEKQVVELRRKIISAVENSEIELTEWNGKWTLPCPKCESDNKAVYRWIYQKNSEEVLPSNDNLKLKKEKNKRFVLNKLFKFRKKDS